jgi:hypothetical protein
MKNDRLTAAALLAAASVSHVAACDFCAVYSATKAHGETGPGLYAGVAEQFTHFGTLQDEGAQVANPTGQYLDSSITLVFAGYKFNNRWGVQFNAPLIYRSFRRPEGSTIDQGTESGLGDVSIIGTYLVYRRLTEDTTALWDILGGVKFPTGNTDRLKEEFNEVEVPGAPVSGIHGHDLTLGSGSYDGLLGTSIYARRGRLFLGASVQYSIRSEGDFGYAFANDLIWSGGPGVLLLLNEAFTLSLQANISGETKGRDTFQGQRAEDTGMTAVYAGPAILFTWGERLSAEAGVDLPASIENTSLQAVPDYRVRAAMSWRF